jgi:hypothetical protein
MNKFKISLIIVLITQTIFSQVKDENIGTEVVNVVKPYTPTISDAFKVKETPSFDDEETQSKEKIEYNIFSFPVASTFTPAKGKAASVDKAVQEKLFSNYVTLGAGNYGTINAELFVTHAVSNTDYVGAMLRHKSSQGGINDVVLDDKYFDTSLDLNYGSKTRSLSWNADLGYQNQSYNWYGLDPITYNSLTPTDQSAFINSIDSKQTYNTLNAGGRLSLNESFFKETSIKFTRFWDAFESAENRFVIKPRFEFNILDEKIKANFLVDYLNGEFKNDYFNNPGLKYGTTILGFSPSFNITKDDYSVNLGAAFVYGKSNESGDSKFFIYPQITASYKVVGDLMIAYAGAEGNLKQNTYSDFVQENFFVSPTLGISPTDQKFDIYLGLKGKLANTVGYNIRASVANEDNKALFKNNIYSFLNTNTNGYAYGNSFGVIYDNIKTLSFYGELKADLSKNVSFGVNGTFSSYSTNVEQEAWNLPGIQLAANLDFNITPKWYAGTKVFFVGERKDQFVTDGIVVNSKDITLDSYFDLNAHIGYKHNARLTMFLKGSNLANQNYQKYLNYPVQGLQILLGANYKFDF